MTDEGQRAAQLNYIDKVHAALFEAGRREHGIGLLLNVLTLVVIFLSSGTISLDQRFSFAGLMISIPQSPLLVCAACVIPLLQYYDRALVSYQERLRQSIVNEYESLGFTPALGARDGRWSAFVYPDAATVVSRAVDWDLLTPAFMKPFENSLPQMVATKKVPRKLLVRWIVFLVSFVLLLLAVVLIPLFAEAMALRAVVIHQGWTTFTIGAILLVVGLNALTYLSAATTVPSIAHDALFRVLGMVSDALGPTTYTATNVDSTQLSPSSEVYEDTEDLTS